MLPVGYPHSVHPNFLPFSAWNFAQSVSGSANGVLATQCLLVGLGLAASSNGTLALAATLNWILKDGLGQLGGILFVARYGSNFDRDAKRYRLLASAMMSLASFFEMLVPVMPTLFLPIAACANVCKNVAWMGMSATKAQIHRHFSRIDNLGDLTGKAASLNTTASLAGTGLGVLLSSMFLTSAGSILPSELVTRCLLLSLPLTVFYLYASYKSCRLAVSPRLSLQRLDIVLKSLLPNVIKSDALVAGAESELSRYILDPARTGYKEKFLPWQRSRSLIRFEPDFQVFDQVCAEERQEALEFFEQHRFIACHAGKNVSIWFDEHASSIERLRGILAVYIANALQSGSWFERLIKGKQLTHALEEDGLFKGLEARGWKIEEEMQVTRNPLSMSGKLD